MAEVLRSLRFSSVKACLGPKTVHKAASASEQQNKFRHLRSRVGGFAFIPRNPNPKAEALARKREEPPVIELPSSSRETLLKDLLSRLRILGLEVSGLRYY